MAKIAILGAGIGGLSQAYELRQALDEPPDRPDQRLRPLRVHPVEPMGRRRLAHRAAD